MTSPLQDPGFYRDRYPLYAALRGKAPVLRVPLMGELPTYVVTGYDAAREAFTCPEISKDAARFFGDNPNERNLHPAVSQNMLTADPPQHTRLRNLVTKAFTPGAVARLRPYIEQLANSLLDSWIPGAAQPIDVIATFAGPLPVTVICQLLGVPEADRAAVQKWSNDLFATGDHQRIDAASHALADYMAGLITAKRQAPDESLISELIAARDGDDKLDEDELVAMSVLLLVAGHETTTAFIGNALLALLQNPTALKRLQDDPDQISSAINELLRYDAPVSIATFRCTTDATEVDGADLPAGAVIFVSPGAANRDPSRFGDPDKLDLDRNARGHLSFGYGIHRCLGAALAQAEGEIALRAIITRFPNLRLAVAPNELPWRHARLVRGLVSLPVHV